MIKTLLKIVAVIFSAGMMIAAFPPYNFAAFAWLALIPFFIVMFTSSLSAVMGYAGLWSIIFNGAMVFGFFALDVLIPQSVIVGIIFSYVVLQTVVLLAIVFIAYWVRRWLVVPDVLVKRLWDAINIAVFWSLADWARSLGTLGTTQGSFMYSQYLVPQVLQITRLLGPYSIVFGIVLVSALGAQCIISLWHKECSWLRWAKTGAVLLGITMLMAAYSLYSLDAFTAVTQQKKVAVFQPAIPQTAKLDRDVYPRLKNMYIQNIRAYSQLRNADLIILPETIVAEFLLNDNAFMFDLKDAIEGALIFGTPRYVDRNIDTSYTNAVVLLNKYGQLTLLHDKKYLVPFGEYLPLRKILYPLLQSTGFFDSVYSAGKENQSVAGYGTAICFESTFPYQLREQTKSGAEMLFVVTNDAWYRQSNFLEMHLACAVLRAVENNRYVVQAANTGISAVIDNKGRIVKQTEVDKRQWLESVVPLIADKTLYTLAGEIMIHIIMIYLVLLVYIILMRIPENIFTSIIEKK